MKNEIGELRRAGKNEEADRLTSELEHTWNKHRGEAEKRPQGEGLSGFNTSCKPSSISTRRV